MILLWIVFCGRMVASTSEMSTPLVHSNTLVPSRTSSNKQRHYEQEFLSSFIMMYHCMPCFPLILRTVHDGGFFLKFLSLDVV